VIPHPGGLAWADGRLSLPAGALTAAWRHTRKGFTLSVIDHGAGTSGIVAVPRLGANRVIYVNGVEAWNGRRLLGAPGIRSADQDAAYVYFRGVRSGHRSFAWRTKP
jgi:hypothetical protein